MKQDPYRVLGLAPTARRDDVRAAYRKLARQYHPDASGDPETATQFHRVTEAYESICRGPEEVEVRRETVPGERPRPAPEPRTRFVVDERGPGWQVSARWPDRTEAGAGPRPEPLIPPRPRGRPEAAFVPLDVLLRVFRGW